MGRGNQKHKKKKRETLTFFLSLTTSRPPHYFSLQLLPEDDRRPNTTPPHRPPSPSSFGSLSPTKTSHSQPAGHFSLSLLLQNRTDPLLVDPPRSDFLFFSPGTENQPPLLSLRRSDFHPLQRQPPQVQHQPQPTIRQQRLPPAAPSTSGHRSTINQPPPDYLSREEDGESPRTDRRKKKGKQIMMENRSKN